MSRVCRETEYVILGKEKSINEDKETKEFSAFFYLQVAACG